jgi:hypothetical protein
MAKDTPDGPATFAKHYSVTSDVNLHSSSPGFGSLLIREKGFRLATIHDSATATARYDRKSRLDMIRARCYEINWAWRHKPKISM